MVLANPSPETLLAAALHSGKLHALMEGFDRRVVRRGQVLVREGEPANRFFVVHSGRFSVHTRNSIEPVAEIGQGELVGEIGFFADLPRTATVIAARDSIVIEVDRARFEDIVNRVPTFASSVIASLAHRLAERRQTSSAPNRRAAIRTMAVLPAGHGPLSLAFIDTMRKVFCETSSSVFITKSDISDAFAGRDLGDQEVLNWLNELEARSRFVCYIADDELNAWTELSIRQADLVLLVAAESSSPHLNPSEELAMAVHPRSARRLAILHRARSSRVSNTAAWLRDRSVFQHHHVALQDRRDIERLLRFLSGTALGFVAGGGGSYGSAHIGVFDAFAEAGATFDYLGGTSAGAAMMAAVALGTGAEQIARGVHNIFIRSRAFRRPTVPRYALLDHKAYDRALQAEYGDTRIEDLWQPYFAISSNLSSNGLYVHREGMVWHAVRASGSIPGLLPPFFTADGDMLVDGAIMDNLPLETMKALKCGPNVVVSVGASGPRKYPIDYDSIPGPVELARRMINPFERRHLPPVPSMLQIIAQSMLAHRPLDHPLDDADVLVCPPIQGDLGFMDWSRHSALVARARIWTADWIEQQSHELAGLRAMLRNSPAGCPMSDVQR
jgi:NTE family protein